MPKKTVELPSEEEIQAWMIATFSHLNPDVRDFFYLGIQALYVKLGGNTFIAISLIRTK